MDYKTLLEQQNITVDAALEDKIERYKTLLLKWNATHNLTGIRSEEQLDAFIADALYPLAFLPPVKTALDIGTGAGFPGMILAMALPQTHFTLSEPLVKRASFLQFVKADLALDNVSVANVRVETLNPQVFDLITSRAVTDTAMLMQLAKGLYGKGSLLLFYKGEKVYDEVDNSLNYRIIQTQNRHYLLIES